MARAPRPKSVQVKAQRKRAVLVRGKKKRVAGELEPWQICRGAGLLRPISDQVIGGRSKSAPLQAEWLPIVLTEQPARR
jgi:hypothetical protein